MYRNLLVPVSFDDNRHPETAIAVARHLASPDARVTLLHVRELLPTYVMEQVPADVMSSQHETALKSLQELAADVPNCHTAVVEGSAGRGITTWARENDADCIVIASHRPVMSDILLGSTAAWVVRHADCAVHVVR